MFAKYFPELDGSGGEKDDTSLLQSAETRIAEEIL